MEHDVDQVVLVTGATGAIGPSVVQAFLVAGYGVRTLALDPPLRGRLPNQVSVMIGDVSDPKAVKSAMDGVSLVIHLAALLHVFDPPRHMHEKYERINVGGTATVVEGAVRSGIERVVFFSTIAVYGYSDGQILTEDSPTHPGSVYAQTKLDAEQIVLDARRADGNPLGTVLRLAAVYGLGIKGNYRRLVRSLACKRFIPIGDGTNRRTLIYARDVAKAAVLAARHPAAAGKLFNVTDGQYHTTREIIDAICGALGRKPPRLNLPAGTVRSAAGLIEDLAGCFGVRSPVGRAMVEKYIEDVAVSGDKIMNELGFSPEFDLTRGWRETIREMRQAGEF